MPVRIRLAYHPLARKKEPLYHIVVAKSKSGRQRKPLEVVGVYDPIPRYPTDPTGKVLEDLPKSKKVSMNIDRIRYWLSVGAQPTDHCARLLAKANIMPKKPAYKDRLTKVHVPGDTVSTTLAAWGSPRQGVAKLLASTTKVTSTPLPVQEQVRKAVIDPTGEHIESEIRRLSTHLVSNVVEESRFKEFSAKPGRPNLHTPYAVASPQVLHDSFIDWWTYCAKTENIPDVIKSRFDVGGLLASTPMRFFMAYIQPLPIKGTEYNSLRYRLFMEWMDVARTYPPVETPEKIQSQEITKIKDPSKPQEIDDFDRMRKTDLFHTLKILFGHWNESVTRLEGSVEGWREKGLATDIRQRVELLKFAETNKELKDVELTGWNTMWSRGKAFQQQGKKEGADD